MRDICLPELPELSCNDIPIAPGVLMTDLTGRSCMMRHLARAMLTLRYSLYSHLHQETLSSSRKYRFEQGKETLQATTTRTRNFVCSLYRSTY